MTIAYEAATIAKWKEVRPGEDADQLSRLLAEDTKMAVLAQIAFEAGRDWQSKHSQASVAFPDYNAPETAIEIGAIESTGEHKGEIYGGIFPDGRPGWILEEPKRLTHYDAVELKGRALPTREEGKYIDTIKDKGALKDIFARHSDSSSSAGFFWLAEHSNLTSLARYQQFSDGSQGYYYGRNVHLPVLSVFR
jgi:hypothetical protein